jgi:vitamin B12 transporter
MHGFLLPLLAFLLFAVPLPALSEEVPVTRLPEVVVTATAEPAPATDLPVHVQVIGREEIERSGANDLSELLLYRIPDAVRSAPGQAAVSMRGFRTRGFGGGPDFVGRVLVLIDGHRSGMHNMGMIPLDNVERVEIVRGPASVLYGGSAMGGVVNVITRRGERPPSAAAGAEYGSFEYSQLRAGFNAATPDERLGLAVAGRATSRGDYKTGSGKILENSDYSDQALSTSLTYRIRPGHELHAVGNVFSADDIGSPGASSFPTPGDRIDEEHRYVSLTYSGGDPENGFAWSASGHAISHEYAFFSAESEFFGFIIPASENVTKTSTQGVRLQGGLPLFEAGRLTLGGEYDRIEARQRETVYSPSTDYDIVAVFAEERVVLDRLSLYLGGRYDYYRLRTLETEGIAVEGGKDTFGHASWRGGAVYDALDWLSLRAAVGTGFRPPAAEELTGAYATPFGPRFGNPDLQVETSITYEGGLDLYLSRFRSGATLFHTASRDTIVGIGNTWVNLDGISLNGLEGYAEYSHAFGARPRPLILRPYANWIYYFERKNEDKFTAESLGTDTVPYVPDFSMTIGLGAEMERLAGLNANVRYQGRQTIEAFDPVTFDPIGQRKSSLFIAAFRLWTTPWERWKLYLDVDNLFDRDYEFVDGYPMPGRTVIAGVEFRF